MVLKMMKWKPSKKFEAKITVHQLKGLPLSSPKLRHCSGFSVEIKWKGSKGIWWSSLRRKVRRNFTEAEFLREDGVVQWDDEFKRVCSFSPCKDGLFHPWEVSFAVFNGSKLGTNNNVPLVTKASLNLSDFASAAEKQNREISFPLSITGSTISLHLLVSLLELRNAEEPSNPLPWRILSFPLTRTSTSTSATTSASIFGLATKPSSFTAPVFKFGASIDPSAAVSAASASKISGVADLRTNAEIEPSFGSSSSSLSTVSAFAATSSGSSTLSYSTENNLQGSVFANTSKPLVSGAAIVSQGTSVRSVSSASLPSFATNGAKESVGPSETSTPIKNNDSSVPLKISSPSTEATDSVINNGVSQLPQRKIAFRMSVQEDSLEQDDDVHCNGLVSRPFSENKEAMQTVLTDSDLAPAEAKPEFQPEYKSPLGLILRNTSELSSPGSSAITIGEGSNVIAYPASQETTAASQSAVLPLSVAPFDKPKEATNPPPSFSFSSKVDDTFPFLPSESIKRAESKLEISGSLLNVSTTGSLVKISESDQGFQVNLQKAGDAASNGPPVSSPPPVSFNAASSSDTKQPFTGSAFLFTSSTSVPTGTSTLATNSASIFGLATDPPSSTAPVSKLGASVDPSTVVSVASTSNISGVADPRTNAEMNPSSGSSSSSLSTVSAFAVTSSGSSAFGLGSSLSYSTENNLQGSLFANASIPLVSDAATVSQGSSVPSVSSASLLSFTRKGTKESVGPSETSNPIKNNDSSVPLKISSPSMGATDSVINNGVSQLPQRKIAFRMSVQEDSLEQDDDVHCNGLAARPFSENKGPRQTVLTDGNLAPAEEPKSFGALSTSSAATNASPSIRFSFGTASAPTNASLSAGFSFGASTNASQPAGFSFVASSASSAPTKSPRPSPFMFGGQQNQTAPQNLSLFQASGSLGGSLLLGSGGGDQSGRKINRKKNRKK